MRKASVVEVFVGSLVRMAASVVLFIVAGAPAPGSAVVLMDGPGSGHHRRRA